MKIHTKLSRANVSALLRDRKLENVGFHTLEYKASRLRDHAFEVGLMGTNERQPNGNLRHRTYAGDDLAATYDEWGWFFAALFEADPEALATGARRYDGREDFHTQTENKFTEG